MVIIFAPLHWLRQPGITRKSQVKQRGLIEITIDRLTEVITEDLLSCIDIYEPARVMHSLNISGCYGVTDRGVCDVLGSVKGLKCCSRMMLLLMFLFLLLMKMAIMKKIVDLTKMIV